MLPPDASYLPRYFEVFLQRVARHAHKYAHLDDNAVFDVKGFNNDCRTLLYNTERNLKRRSSAEHASVDKENTAAVSGRPLYRHEPSSGAEEDGDEFFNFTRTKKQKVAENPQTRRQESTHDGDHTMEANKEDNVRSQVEGPSTPRRSPCTPKRSGSAGNTPFRKTAMKRVSVWEHLQSIVEDGVNVDDIIQVLRAYNRSFSHRKGYKLACKDVMLLVRDLQDNDGEDDIMELAETYHIALSKLPAIHE